MTEQNSLTHEIKTIPFTEVPYFSAVDCDYVTSLESLSKFYKYKTDPSEFAKIVRDKSHDSVDRNLLTKVITDQYSSIDSLNDENKSLIHSLSSDDTFTVITAHQPCLFSGPLYVIYKAISALKVAKKAAEFTEKNIVPVFIIGGEDHDFDEISHTTVFGKKLKWEQNEDGPVGRLSTSTMYPVLKELESILGKSDSYANKLFKEIQKIYQTTGSFGEATQKLLIHIFGSLGILVVRMDDKSFKERFKSYIEKEIFQQYSYNYVTQSQEELGELGYDEFAHVRQINFFYIPPEESSYYPGRYRIKNDKDSYQIIDTDIKFSASEMADEISEFPERFSPNVVMRPIFQEVIFPNLAYIGGGGELAYWLERKYQFEAFDLNYPMLVRRDSVILVDERSAADLKSLNIRVNDLMVQIGKLTKQYAIQRNEETVSVDKTRKELHQIMQSLAEQARNLDSTLEEYVYARESKIMKLLGNIEDRFVKAARENKEIEIQKLEALKNRLFPSNTLQERKVNYLDYQLRYKDKFIKILTQSLNPFNKRMKVIEFRTDEMD